MALVHSNLKCLRLAREEGWEWVMILEDDCVPHDSFRAVADGSWAQPGGREAVGRAWVEMMKEFERAIAELGRLRWDFINLGPNRQTGYRAILTDRLGVSGFDYATQAMVFSSLGVNNILGRSQRLLGALVAWDDMLQALQLGPEHPLEWGRKLWQDHYSRDGERPLISLSTLYMLTGQGFGADSNSSIALSDVTLMDYQDVLAKKLNLE